MKRVLKLFGEAPRLLVHLHRCACFELLFLLFFIDCFLNNGWKYSYHLVFSFRYSQVHFQKITNLLLVTFTLKLMMFLLLYRSVNRWVFERMWDFILLLCINIHFSNFLSYFKDDVNLFDYNVPDRVNEFVSAAISQVRCAILYSILIMHSCILYV